MQIATTPGLLEIFQKCNETLEQVQKNLEVGLMCQAPASVALLPVH
jgi:hypothetical protein